MFILEADITNPLQITAAGVVIAVLFLASIVGVLGWMLRLPKDTEHVRTATKALRSVNKLSRILVPLLSRNEATDRIVALAAQMTRQRSGNIEVLVIIEVPFTLPLNAHVEEDEKLAFEALDRAESVAARMAIKVNKRILKARSVGLAIVREAEEQAIDLILIANAPVRVRGNVQQIDPTVEYVMKNAPSEVLVLSQVHTNSRSSSMNAGDREQKATIP